MARLFLAGVIAWLAVSLRVLLRLAYLPARYRTLTQVIPSYIKDCKWLAGRLAHATSQGATDSAQADRAQRPRVTTPYHYNACGSTGALHESLQVRIAILPELPSVHSPASSAGPRRLSAHPQSRRSGRIARLRRLRPPGQGLHAHGKCTTL
jgi:hypothetical protein